MDDYGPFDVVEEALKMAEPHTTPSFECFLTTGDPQVNMILIAI